MITVPERVEVWTECMRLMPRACSPPQFSNCGIVCKYLHTELKSDSRAQPTGWAGWLKHRPPMGLTDRLTCLSLRRYLGGRLAVLYNVPDLNNEWRKQSILITITITITILPPDLARCGGRERGTCVANTEPLPPWTGTVSPIGPSSCDIGPSKSRRSRIILPGQLRSPPSRGCPGCPVSATTHS